MQNFEQLTGESKEKYEIDIAKLHGDFDTLHKFGYIIKCSVCGSNIIQVFRESTTYAGQKIKCENGNIIYSNVQLQHMGGIEYRCDNFVCMHISRDIDEFIEKGE